MSRQGPAIEPGFADTLRQACEGEPEQPPATAPAEARAAAKKPAQKSAGKGERPAPKVCLIILATIARQPMQYLPSCHEGSLSQDARIVLSTGSWQRQCLPGGSGGGICWHAQGEDEDEDYMGDGGRKEGGQEGSAQPRRQEQASGGNAQKKKGTKRPAPEPAHAAAAEEAQQPKRSRPAEDDARATMWQQAAAPSPQEQVRLPSTPAH